MHTGLAANFSFAWLCQRIVEDSALAITFADRDGVIRLWNAGAVAMFGYEEPEALGKTLEELIVPEKHRAAHCKGYASVMQTGHTKYGKDPLAVPAMTKDGRRISIEFNIVLVHDAEGRVLGAAATIHDVTARWEKEKALRARIAELEHAAKGESK